MNQIIIKNLTKFFLLLGITILSSLIFTKLSNAQKKSYTAVINKKYVAGKFKIGTTYQIKGKKYTPKIHHQYSEEGVASWYGKGFRGKLTANGAIFTGNDYTAAHKTLPLPSIVKVTNLKNGKTIEVVVNDRGPFNSRIIDLSQKAAQDLGFMKDGITKVKVEYLHDKTLNLLAMYPEKEQKKAKKAFALAQLS